MKHLFFALFSLIFLAGCEKKKEAEPQDQAKASAKPVAPVSKQETPKTSPKTTAKKPGTVLWEFEKGGVMFSSPAIGPDGTVYVGSVDKKLYAIKIDSKGPAKSPWPMHGQNAQHTGRAP
ncbi:MAG: PQQ-binding-like beta-propeller repeat protein [Verrucomicrobiales bacterium]|jgi:hypothetical protein|nr:PQQ-binding-like beta-propeller repeat protein [Verrucomicrobiales bacterium]